jgi:hypothetical protein
VGVIARDGALEMVMYNITMEEKGSSMLQKKITSFKLISVVGVSRRLCDQALWLWMTRCRTVPFPFHVFWRKKKEAAMWHNMIVGCIGRSIITESYGNFRGIKLVNIDPSMSHRLKNCIM